MTKVTILLAFLTDVIALLLFLAAIQAGSYNLDINRALFLASTALLCSTAIAVAVLWRASPCLCAMYAAFGFWYQLPMIVAGLAGEVLIGAGRHPAPANAVGLAGVAVCLCRALLSLTYLATTGRRHRPQPEGKGRRLASLSTVAVPRWLIAGYALLGFVPFGVTSESITAALLAGRSPGGVLPTATQGTADSLVFTLLYFSAAGALLGARQLLFFGRGHKAAYIVLIFGCLAPTLVPGTRTYLLLLGLPSVGSYLLATRRLSLRHVLVLGLSSTGMLLVSEFLAAYRDLGYASGARGAAVEHRTFIDNDFFSELVFSMEIVPAQQRFSYESPLFHVLIGPVPRALWKAKPTVANVDYVMRARMNRSYGELGGNILPGVVGQYWEVSGWLGVSILGAWLGLLSTFVDRRLATVPKEAGYLLLTLVAAVFVGFRMLAASLFIPLAMMAGTLWVLSTVGLARGRRGMIAVPALEPASAGIPSCR